MHQLPESVVCPNGEPTTAPAYRLAGPGYYGDTYFQEGEVIVTMICPNDTMIPLNQAAADVMAKWKELQPITKEAMDAGLMSEAAMLLRNDPQFLAMSNDQAGEAIYKMAVGLQRKRNERAGVMTMPSIPGAYRPQANVPPMPNTKWTDPNMRGPGHSERSVLHQPVHGASVARPMTGIPPRAAPGNHI